MPDERIERALKAMDKAIAAVTLEQANSALRRHLKPETFVIGVGGDFK